MATRKYNDYESEIQKAVLAGDYTTAQNLEKERNAVIDSEGIDYSKTYRYQTPQNYSKPQSVTDTDKMVVSSLNNLTQKTNQNAVSHSVRNQMSSTFKTPKSVKQADAYLSQALKQIQSGKTSYSDEIQGMMDKIMKRDKFSYDADTDQLFQQALASAMNSGKQAMQDTIGQASALTGGYGSSYATSAGNQAYNAFIEDAYDNLPQYYQMAMEAYQMEGDEMYRQLGMFTDADDREYSRLLNAYDATSQYRNRAYDEAYGIFRDTKSDAFSMANFQLNEHNQMVSDAYNLYNAVANYGNTLYDRSYQEWADSINMALQQFGLQQSGAIANRDFNRQQERDAIADAWTQKQFDYQKERDAVEDAFRQKEFDLNERVTNAQIANMGRSGGSTPKTTKLKYPEPEMFDKALMQYEQFGEDGFYKYIDKISDEYDKELLAYYVRDYGKLPKSATTKFFETLIPPGQR